MERLVEVALVKVRALNERRIRRIIVLLLHVKLSLDLLLFKFSKRRKFTKDKRLNARCDLQFISDDLQEVLSLHLQQISRITRFELLDLPVHDSL
jgi:hypothetical protein